ncbi:MAG TPA: hypothetical protein PK210_05305 [Bacteroidia bacterium]|nr:hypothetical protein [Bacteroidia bacterium]
MKKLILLILTFACSLCNAQINLVPNPSFEDTVSCPLVPNQVEKALYWSSYRPTPDYYNYCSSMQMGMTGVPYNFLGFQYPHSGDAFMGMIPYELTGPTYREYIGVQLLQPTIIGQKYFVTFYVNFNGTIGFTIAINKLGVALSTVSYSDLNPYPITNNPIAYSDSIYTDSLNWSKVQLSFVADSAYNYLILGNFFDDVNTDTLNLGIFNTHSYYYIDDVCLSTDSVYCSGVANFNEVINQDFSSLVKEIKINENNITIDFNKLYHHKSVVIYSYDGKLIYNIKTQLNEINIPTPSSNSIYLIYCTSGNIVYSKKIQILNK